MGAILWRIRVLVGAAILALGGTGIGAQTLESETDDPPFAAVWHLNGVETSAGGYGIQLLWVADSYDLKLPGYRRATSWRWGDDIRQRAGIMVSCRVPATPGGDHERLKATLLLGGNWPRRGKEAVTIPVRVHITGWEFKAVLKPERDPLDREELLSAMVKWLDGLAKGPVPDPAGPVVASAVEQIGPVAVIEAIAANTEAAVTLEGEKAQVELRFKADPEKAKVAQLMAQHCAGR